MRPTVTEIRALVPLLEQDWGSPEELATALIKALDEARADRKTFYGVMRFGSPPNCFYSGVGPYGGRKSAMNAVEKHGKLASMDFTWAIVPMLSDEGFKDLLARVDAPPKRKQD